MSEERATNNDIMRSLGRIEEKIDGHSRWMTAHVAEDKIMAADIQTLKIAHAKHKGFMAALVGIGGLISGAIGYAAEYFHRG